MISNLDAIYLWAALLCAIIASYHDVSSRRIPNWLTGPAIVAGLLFHLLAEGVGGLGLSLLAGLIAGSAFIFFFLAGGMGAGDVKLMMAVACLAGTGHLREILLATVFSGAIAATLLVLVSGRLSETVRNLIVLLEHHGRVGVKSHAELNVRNSATLRIPYALPIAAGCAFVIASTTNFGLTR